MTDWGKKSSIGDFNNTNMPGANFNSPRGMAIDETHIWVANEGNDTVTELDYSGNLVQSLSTAGAFDGPFGIAIDTSGSLWVSNQHGNSVLKLTHQDVLISNFNDNNIATGPRFFPFGGTGRTVGPEWPGTL